MTTIRKLMVVTAVALVVGVVAGCEPAPRANPVDDAIHRYFGDSPELEDKARRIAWCESRHDPSAINRTTWDYGLFQINRYWNEAAFERLGYDWDRDILDPYKNARMARYLYDAWGGNWDAWVCDRYTRIAGAHRSLTAPRLMVGPEGQPLSPTPPSTSSGG